MLCCYKMSPGIYFYNVVLMLCWMGVRSQVSLTVVGEPIESDMMSLICTTPGGFNLIISDPQNSDVNVDNVLQSAAHDGMTVECIPPTGYASTCNLTFPVVREKVGGLWRCREIAVDTVSIFVMNQVTVVQEIVPISDAMYSLTCMTSCGYPHTYLEWELNDEGHVNFTDDVNSTETCDTTWNLTRSDSNASLAIYPGAHATPICYAVQEGFERQTANNTAESIITGAPVIDTTTVPETTTTVPETTTTVPETTTTGEGGGMGVDVTLLWLLMLLLPLLQ